MNKDIFESVAKSYIDFFTYSINEYSGYTTPYLPCEQVGHSRFTDLLMRIHAFGVLGHIIEGDLAPQDLEDIKKFSIFESVFDELNSNTVCKTLQHAFTGRIKLCLHDKLPLEDIYDMQFYLLDEEGLSVEELAALSNTSVASVRNEWVNFKGNDIVKSCGGKSLLKVSIAAQWLKSRKEYKPNKNLSGMKGYESDYVNVPVAADGTYFCFACAYKRGGYTVGPKGDEIKIECFEDALTQLTEMPLAKWRRPNIAGNYGIVSAVEWRRIRREELSQSLYL